MRSYHIWTIGCQMNKADSERLESAMGQMGLSSAASPRDADVIVLNSCVVRQSAEDRAVGMLTSLKPLKERNPDKVIALMGCMVGPKSEPLEKRFPYADVFMRPQEFEPLINLLGDRMGVDPEGCIGPLTATPDVTTFIPISHGCDKMCSFCIIPYRRGRDVSRPVTEIVRESELLAERGVKEVTLLGQNVDSYGHDLPDNPDLGDLLVEINDIEGLERVRFLTSHPNDMTDHIIDTVAELDKVCEHFNLPFQAGGRRGAGPHEARVHGRPLPAAGGPDPGAGAQRIAEHGRDRRLLRGDGRAVRAYDGHDPRREVRQGPRGGVLDAARHHRGQDDGGRRTGGGEDRTAKGGGDAAGRGADGDQLPAGGGDDAGPGGGPEAGEVVRAEQERQAGVLRGRAGQEGATWWMWSWGRRGRGRCRARRWREDGYSRFRRPLCNAGFKVSFRPKGGIATMIRPVHLGEQSWMSRALDSSLRFATFGMTCAEVMPRFPFAGTTGMERSLQGVAVA